jgi:hypothetical protein
MMVLSSKNPEYITMLPLVPNKPETSIVNISTFPVGSVPWQEEAIGDVQ